jgi:hypothetical protein
MTDPNTPPAAPTRADRRRLVAQLQTAALAQASPLAANLGVLTGDLIHVAHALAEHVRAADAGDAAIDRRPAGGGRAAPDVEQFLKVMRQVDRLAEVGRRLAAED